MQADNPEEYDRIASLRDGIRSAKRSDQRGTYVLCQMGKYQQLSLTDADGEVVTRDLADILGTLRCDPGEPTVERPEGHNQRVMALKRVFDTETKQLAAQRDRTLSLNLSQRYVIRELKLLFQRADEDTRVQLGELERAYRVRPTTAVTRELNRLRLNHVTGKPLLAALTDIYHQHRLADTGEQRAVLGRGSEVPRVICSEALV